MKRIDCEKCLHSYFDDDKLRCRLKKCQPEYSDMVELKELLIESFPNSFINEHNEFIAHKQSNEYFRLDDCEYPEDIECKVLEWLSRAAYKSQWYSTHCRNEKFRRFMRNGINDFLDTDFSEEEFGIIYEKLGNAINHDLTMKFVQSGYDFSLLN